MVSSAFAEWMKSGKTEGPPPPPKPRRTAYERFLRSPRWQTRREAKLRTVGWRCEECGRGGRLQVHHRNYNRPWGREKDKDLVALCSMCHVTEHVIKDSKRK